MSEHSLRSGSVLAVNLPAPPDVEPPGRTRLAAEDRRSAILDATIPLLVRHGVQVTTRQIADAAGVAEGTLFRVFDDKGALVVAALARAFDPAPVVDAVRAIDLDRDLDTVLEEVVHVVSGRSGDLRTVMNVAQELRRAAQKNGHTDAHGPILDPDHPDKDRPGSMAHSVFALRSRAIEGPQRIREALVEVFEAHRSELRRDPEVCGRMLLSLLSTSMHDTLTVSEQLTAREVVEVFLDGIRAREAGPATTSPTTSETTSHSTAQPTETPC